MHTIPIDDLLPDPGNVRAHPDRNKQAALASLKRFGAARSIVVDKNGIVRAGNATLEAARAAGIKEAVIVETTGEQLVVVKRPDWSDTEATGYAVADNRVAEHAEWDDAALAETLQALQNAELDLGDVGFSREELDELLSGLEPEPADSGQDDPGAQVDRAAELQAKWQTERGQLWLIPSQAMPGREHRLLCGDCRDYGDIERLCSESVQGAFTSPPYAEQRKHQYGGVPADEYVTWWEEVQSNVRAVLRPDGSFFVNIKAHCEDGERSLYVMDLVLAMKRQWGWRYVDEFCWRNGGVPGKWPNRFKNQWEPVYHFSVENEIKMRYENVTHESDDCIDYDPERLVSGSGFMTNKGRNDRYTGMALPGNVLNFGAETGLADVHSAPFPVGLPTFFLKAFSDSGDSWLEPFCGSGTTIVAAEQTGRLCYGCEIEPRYVAVTLERLAGLGLEPRRAD